jgi:hypothetical protein
MRTIRICALILLFGSFQLLVATDNLKLNPKLDYNSDSQDGPLITGDNAQGGAVKGKVNYIIIFEQG